MKPALVAVIAYISCISCIFTFVSPVAWSDSPLPLAQRHGVLSPSGKFLAETDPGTNAGSTTVYEMPGHQLRWSIPGYFSSFCLADDGEHWADEYWGQNLLGMGDDRPETVVATVHRRNQVVRKIALREVENLSQLKQTASHKFWGSVEGFEPGTLTLKISDADYKIVRFEIKDAAASGK